MNMTEKSIIGELVAEDYRTASVFKKHKIDFCCQGNRTIGEACDKNKVDPAGFLKDLETARHTADSGHQDFQNWPIDLLADYIEKKHHSYVEEKTQEIVPFLYKVARVHGVRHPELLKIEAEFQEAKGALAAHMKKEEFILFPFIRKMVQAEKDGKALDPPHFGTVENPVAMMKHEHDVEGERFRTIASLSNDYTPPEDACNTYRVTFALLKEFEEDLHMHIHLENNILFPKAIAREKSLRETEKV